MERIDRPPSARLKIANIRNKFSLLLADRVGLTYHRFIGSSVHRFIGSSVHRFIGSRTLRPGADGSTYRFPHPYSLTPGPRPVIAHGLTGNPITVSGLDGLVRSSAILVTRDLAFSGSGSDVTPSHLTTIGADSAKATRPITDVVRFWLGPIQRLWPKPKPILAFMPPN